MKLWHKLTDAPPVHTGASAELSDWPTIHLRFFRDDLAAAFDRARDANDQHAIDAALRLIGRVETELANRK